MNQPCYKLMTGADEMPDGLSGYIFREILPLVREHLLLTVFLFCEGRGLQLGAWLPANKSVLACLSPRIR
jgi:hypothetical protein